MADNKFERCEPDDPSRCQGMTRTGQCPFKSMPDVKNCAMHGGPKSTIKNEKIKSNLYRLQIWQDRIDEFSESEGVKTLKNEVGILRLLLESLLNRCSTDMDLILNSPKISDLCTKLEKLVNSSNRLDLKLGSMLDKTAALRLASSIVEIISSEINDADVIDRISGRIIDTLGQLSGPTE